MNINKVDSVSFGKFYVNDKGAYELASALMGKPELEQKFMKKLVEPLSHAKEHNVLVNGYGIRIIDNEGNLVMGVIQTSSAGCDTLGVIGDPRYHWRSAVWRSSKDVVPTYDFSRDGHWFSYIETAKNIIFDRENLVLDDESMIASQAADEYAKIASETFEQKRERFMNLFNINS